MNTPSRITVVYSSFNFIAKVLLTTMSYLSVGFHTNLHTGSRRTRKDGAFLRVLAALDFSCVFRRAQIFVREFVFVISAISSGGYTVSRTRYHVKRFAFTRCRRRKN